MKSKIELSELIELIELANNPNTIYLADKLFKEKIANTLFVTDLGERTVTCEYQGLHYHGGDRIGIFIGCINEYVLCSTNIQLDNNAEIKVLKNELNRRTNRDSRTNT